MAATRELFPARSGDGAQRTGNAGRAGDADRRDRANIDNIGFTAHSPDFREMTFDSKSRSETSQRRDDAPAASALVSKVER